MTQEQIKEYLEVQLKLLSKRSLECHECDAHGLARLTEAMLQVVKALTELSF